MAIKRVNVEEFLKLGEQAPVLDVRSPGEFVHAHIPGAISFPLFTDEERKVVGTKYKQESKQVAVKAGLAYFGPRMVTMVEQAEEISRNNNYSKTLLVHCWRGGMRSAGVAWLLDLYGFEIYTLIGGYKAFRQWTLKQFEKSYSFNVLGGFTGSGKTFVLQEMMRLGKNVIDLEALASHKGSAFGSINMPVQSSQEMFENKLAVELFQKSAVANGEEIWLEDESQRIGLNNIPISLWKQLRSSPLYFLDIDFEKRLQHIISGYGKGDKDKLVNAIIRIQKRLGGLETKTAINFLLEDNLEESFRILLKYYDKQYQKGLTSRDNLEDLLRKIECKEVDAKKNARRVTEFNMQTL
jgi:tRNA 2-selenouridine synthase